MPMNENGWVSLSELWRSTSQSVNAAPLRRAVAAHRKWLLVATMSEIAIFIGLVWVTAVVFQGELASWKVVWAVSVWAFAAVAYAFVWWNRRNTWAAMGDSVAGYVRLIRLRAERQLRSLRFGIALFVAEAVVVVVQLVWFDRFTRTVAILVAASAIVIGIWCIVVKRKIARDLAIASDYDDDHFKPSAT